MSAYVSMSVCLYMFLNSSQTGKNILCVNFIEYSSWLRYSFRPKHLYLANHISLYNIQPPWELKKHILGDQGSPLQRLKKQACITLVAWGDYARFRGGVPILLKLKIFHTYFSFVKKDGWIQSFKPRNKLYFKIGGYTPLRS